MKTTICNAPFNRFIQTFIAVTLSTTSVSLAAQPIPDAGQLLRQQEQLKQPIPQQLPAAESETEVVKPALKEIAGIKLQLKGIRFSGAADLVSEAELKALVEDAVGKEQDFAALQALADKVTAHLRAKGWLLARAYLPRQEIADGILEIAILKGRLDGAAGQGGWQIELADGARIKADRLQAIVETAAPSGSVVRQDQLERGLLLLNDLPGITARSRLEPGRDSGTTRIIVDASEGPRYTGYAWADNHGSNSVGTEQLSAALNLNDPLGHGDQANASLTASQGMQLARLGYSHPLGASGLRTNIGYTDMHYKVVQGAGVTTGIKGHSGIARAGLDYPLIRTRTLTLRANLGYDHKALKDDSKAGAMRDKRIDVLTLGLDGNNLDDLGGGGLNQWDIGLTAGSLDLSNVASDKAADAASLRTHGSYNKLSYSASRLQKLPQTFTLLGRINGQWTDKNLDSSEEFILGGPNGVRAYPIGEASGDRGWLASLELRYDLPGGTPLGALQLSTFADIGGIEIHAKPGSVAISNDTGKNNYRISGAGLGASLTKTARYNLRLTWAHTHGNNDGSTLGGSNADGKRYTDRFWLQGVYWF